MKFIRLYRFLLFLCLVSWTHQSVAQNSKIKEIDEVCNRLDSGLLNRDTVALKIILHQQLSLGHSNGLIEDRKTLFEHLQTGYLRYNQIKEEGTKEVQFVKNIATVRRQLKVNGAVEGQSFDIKLKVLEVWLKEDKKWKLLCRQSVKSF